MSQRARLRNTLMAVEPEEAIVLCGVTGQTFVLDTFLPATQHGPVLRILAPGKPADTERFAIVRNADQLRLALEERGYEVHLARDGLMVLRKLGT